MRHCRETLLKLRCSSARSSAGVIQNTDLPQIAYAVDLINDSNDSLFACFWVCSYLI